VSIKRSAVFLGACLFTTLLVPRFSRAAIHQQLVVNNTAGQCPNAKYTHIQDAINAASAGDEIRICNGTYNEQLVINKSLDIDADTGVFLVPAPMQANTASLATGDAIAAAVVVSGAGNVSISGLTVDGISNGISACAPRVIGIYFQNSSGQIQHAAVRNFKLGVSDNGCQSGTGIFVESGGSGASTVEISDASIHDFQKNGITANGAGTDVHIHNNTVTGLGPTTGAAQNGIQIGFSATGSIRENVVTNLIWSPCTDANTCQAVATAILVTQSDNVRISGNTAGVTQVGIFVDGNNATIRGNKAFSAAVFDDIRVEGNGSRVRENQTSNAGEAGIFVSGNNNVIEENSITDAPVGILKATGSTGNILSGNVYFNVAVRRVDPPIPSLAGKIQPER